MSMLSLFTETLSDLLENQGYGTENQSQSLTEIFNLMNNFPSFIFDYEDISINLPMKQLFLDKYDIREIGAETEQLFLHNWKEKINELLIKYVPKMKTWLENFNDLFKFTVTLERKDVVDYKTENQNTYYLNPVNNSVTNLKVNDVDKSDGKSQNILSQSRDVLQSVWGKTRATLMEQIIDLKDIFNDCLNEFEIIFMGVY